MNNWSNNPKKYLESISFIFSIEFKTFSFWSNGKTFLKAVAKAILSLSKKKEMNKTDAKPIPIFPIVLTMLFKKLGMNSKFENDVKLELFAICCKSILWEFK